MFSQLIRNIHLPSSFRARLLGILTLGIVSLALTSALTIAWVTSIGTRAQAIAQGRQITGNLADQCVLALLFESPYNAEKPLKAVMGFPQVDQAGVFDLEGKPILVLGEQGEALAALGGIEKILEPIMVSETAASWHFMAPVFSGASDNNQNLDLSTFQFSGDKKERLGYVYMVMNKGGVEAIQSGIFANNIFIGLAFAIVLVFILNLGIKRLTRPLYQLSAIMDEAKHHGTHTYANLKGPKEITQMAEVFNRMMASLEEQDSRLRKHQEILQSEVTTRTRELVEARDAALTASRHKSEFLANMSHELRTPLQAIIGYSDLVKEELILEGMDQRAEELERVIHNAQRLLSLINNVLGLAKIEAGKVELRIQAVNLRELITEATQTVAPLLRLNNNTLDVNVQGAQELLIDREKLLQSVLNLLSNACKFTKDGNVSLEAVHGTDSLTIRVGDTGIGLTVEQQKVIFEEFRQVDGSTTRKFEGTGLGLAITRRFCELMGGDIEVSSTPRAGSVFTIHIPLPIASLGTEAKATATANEA
jgi:signal transduction histidine kinase